MYFYRTQFIAKGTYGREIQITGIAVYAHVRENIERLILHANSLELPERVAV